VKISNKRSNDRQTKGDEKMKLMSISIAIGIVVAGTGAYAANPPASLSTVPELVNYQGRLVVGDGTPYSNTTHEIELHLYEQAGDSTAVWGEAYSVETQDGYFSVMLGSGGTPLAGSTQELWKVMWSRGGGSPDTYFMGLTILTTPDGNPLALPVEASPRQQFVTSPFAFRAHQSVYAAAATDEFQAPQGINTSTINSTSDVEVTSSLRITGTGNSLHTNEIISDQNSSLEIGSDALMFNGMKLFVFKKQYFAGNSTSAVEFNVSGINSGEYDLMIVGWECDNVTPNVTPRSVYMKDGFKARLEFPTSVTADGYVRVLGIRKGFVANFQY
jgi:hypothetical protein